MYPGFADDVHGETFSRLDIPRSVFEIPSNIATGYRNDRRVVCYLRGMSFSRDTQRSRISYVVEYLTVVKDAYRVKPALRMVSRISYLT